MDSISGPVASVLHPWLPDHVPALMSLSPRDSSGLVLCFISWLRSVVKGAHFDLAQLTTLASCDVEHPRPDELASRDLAESSCRTAAQIRRWAGAGACRGLFEPIAAPGGVVGSRGADGQAGTGAARRAVPASGRRLR